MRLNRIKIPTRVFRRSNKPPIDARAFPIELIALELNAVSRVAEMMERQKNSIISKTDNYMPQRLQQLKRYANHEVYVYVCAHTYKTTLVMR